MVNIYKHDPDMVNILKLDANLVSTPKLNPDQVNSFTVDDPGYRNKPTLDDPDLMKRSDGFHTLKRIMNRTKKENK